MTGLVILLVEDDPLISEVLALALADGGYEIVEAGAGVEALQQIEENVARFRAVVTDIRLGPGPDGWQIARRARELAANMPIVYMSGDSSHDWASSGVPRSVILPKPFAPTQLLTAIATLSTDADMHDVLAQN